MELSFDSAGSTAYNLSVHGPIISGFKIAHYTYQPFRLRRWKGKVLSDSARVLLKI